MELIVDHFRMATLSSMTSDLAKDTEKLIKTLERYLKTQRKLKPRIQAFLFAPSIQSEIARLKDKLADALSPFGAARTLSIDRDISAIRNNTETIAGNISVLDALRIDEPRVGPIPARMLTPDYSSSRQKVHRNFVHKHTDLNTSLGREGDRE